MFHSTSARMLIALLAGTIMAAATGRAQTIWYVDDDAAGDPGPGDPTISDALEDGSAEHPFDAIQEALDAAQDGDTVLVADGTYAGPGNKNLDFAGKAITVHSVNGPENCIIDCENDGRGFYFHSGETATSVVDGFTIQNGDVEWNSSGGGYGGGIHCESSSPTITNCTIRGSRADQDGGGIYCNWGASPTIANCTITGNLAVSYGGGICCYNDSNVTIANCTISENLAIAGSGVASFGCSPTVTNCLLTLNESIGGT